MHTHSPVKGQEVNRSPVKVKGQEVKNLHNNRGISKKLSLIDRKNIQNNPALAKYYANVNKDMYRKY